MSKKSVLLHPTQELLTEAAGVKIIMTPESDEQLPEDCSANGKISVTLRKLNGNVTTEKSYGFHLTKSKWDPYPWVSYVDVGSLAEISGLRAGDCLIDINDVDLIGLKVKAIAALVHNRKREEEVKLGVWRYAADEENGRETGLALKGPLPDIAERLANAVSGAVRVLECPVCLESSTPPISQCVHGHIICVGCRTRTARCPVCRVRLGQGRCLLADKLYRILRDIFGTNEGTPDTSESKHCNLRDYLFGRGHKTSVSVARNSNERVTTKAKTSLLTRLLLGGTEKAASADNLVTVTASSDSTERITSGSNTECNQRLKLNDRMKSASTGELTGGANGMSNIPLERNNYSAVSSTASLTSNTIQTPIWGGSVDSLACGRVACPLSKQTGCKDTLTLATLLEHLSRTHETPQVHFYSRNARIPLPLPFSSEAVYVLHCGSDIFFFQYDSDTAYVTSSLEACQTSQWILHGLGKYGTEIKLRRSIASLEDPLILDSQHVASLPSDLLLHTLNVQIVERNMDEKLNV